MTKPVYRWNGEYFGFIHNQQLYNKYSVYLGWLDGDEVWHADGSYLGEVYRNNYILRPVDGGQKPARPARPTPPRPPAAEMKPDRIPRTSREGYKDALGDF